MYLRVYAHCRARVLCHTRTLWLSRNCIATKYRLHILYIILLVDSDVGDPLPDSELKLSSDSVAVWKSCILSRLSADPGPDVWVSCRKTEYYLEANFHLGMAVYQKGILFFCGAQTVEHAASNATQISVRLCSWIRCLAALIWDVAKSGWDKQLQIEPKMEDWCLGSTCSCLYYPQCLILSKSIPFRFSLFFWEK